jgi:Flp pilus assembly protein TadB
MNPKAFFLEDRVNLLAGLVAVGLFCAGGVALVQRMGVATVFLMMGGFMAVMVLEYRHLNHTE